MTEIITHYIVVSDDAPAEVIREAVRIKSEVLEPSTDINNIKVVRQSELNPSKSTPLTKLEAEL